MDGTLNITFHSIEISFLFSILLICFKQYAIYKAIKERVNIIWRDYCKDHRIPYNALGDDKLVDIANGHGKINNA